MTTTDDDRLGHPVPNPDPRPYPPSTPMTGRYCTVLPLDVDAHAADLFAANTSEGGTASWDHLAYGPFATLDDYKTWLRTNFAGRDPFAHVIIDNQSGKPVGVATYLRIDETNGTIEVGHINYSPLLQRRPAGTEAMYLMMARAFDELGYRRYEWKCNDLNQRSMNAARRYGFTYEGTHRQAIITKGRNRDTAWFSILDSEWPAIKTRFERWLDPANFDADGTQISRLQDCGG